MDSIRSYAFHTADVFTDAKFGGNPLAVFPAGECLSDDEMQLLAAEINYSETTFVLPPADPANTARVRIFNRTAEMPFAGHPNVGTGFLLASLGHSPGGVLKFEEQAGLVEVRIRRSEDGRPTGAEIDAPQPLQVLGELPWGLVARCIGVPPDAIRTATHPPLRASVGVDFVLVEVETEALAGAGPNFPAFREAAAAHVPGTGRLSVLLYERHGAKIRSRMFAPLAGTWEDPATGSANAALAGLLVLKEDLESIALDVSQGVEMGRPSKLAVRAWRSADGIRASVGGACVNMFRGEVDL